MKKILIIGASVLQLPAIKRAKELGMYVGVADFNPKAVGIPFADEYFNVSTIDIDGVCEVAKKFKPDGIMTLATDMPMRSIAAACSQLSLHGISTDTAVKATDKGEMIKVFQRSGVEHPWFYIVKDTSEFSEIKERLTFPCIIKPTDNAGSRGVVLVNKYSELDNAYIYSKEQSRSGAVIVEEYLTGREVSVEIIVLSGEIYVLQVTDKITTGAPHFVEMGHTQPSRLGDDNVEKIKDLAIRAVKAIGISDGPAHVEIMLTEKGPKLIEMGARMGGDCITTHLVPLSTGVSMIDATINIACGENVDVAKKIDKGSAIRYFDVPCGKIKAIRGIEKAKEIPGVCEISILKQEGDLVGEIKSSTDRVGFVIAQGKNAADAEAICMKALSMIKFEIE